MIVIELPFPPKELSPNARVHWSKSAPKKKKLRADARLLTLSASRSISDRWGDRSRVKLDFTIYPPENRDYDRDNMIARLKAAIDGIADGLGVNDKLFDIGTVDFAPKVPGGSVRVHISSVEQP